jgi:hypothetical protein
VAGLVVIMIASSGLDWILEATGVFPSVEEQRRDGFDTAWMLVLALAYRVVFAAVGGAVTALLAPSRPVRHVAVLVIVGAVIGTVGVIATMGVTPAWFAVCLIGLTACAAWLGGRYTVRQPMSFHMLSAR